MPNDGNETFDMEHLLDLAKEKKYRLLKEELVELNEVDIASFIEELDSERTVIVFRMLQTYISIYVSASLPSSCAILRVLTKCGSPQTQYPCLLVLCRFSC